MHSAHCTNFSCSICVRVRHIPNENAQNGQDILDSLSQLKPILVDKYEQWQSSQRTTPGSSRASSTDPGLSREEIARRRREEQDEERARQAREAARREEVWKQEEYVRRQAAERERQARAEIEWQHSGEARREDVGARRAAEARAMAETERAIVVDKQRRDEETRRGEEDRSRRMAADDRRRQEQEGIARRQQEADVAARSARRDISRLTPSPVGGRSSPYPPSDSERNASRPVYAPQPGHPLPPSQPPSFTDSYSTGSTLPVMPLENPNKYDDDSSTDVEGVERRVLSKPQRNDQTPKGKPLVPGYVACHLLSQYVLTTLAEAQYRPRSSPQHLLRRQSWAPSGILRLCHNTN
ncbi:hypothetical protein C8Q78DRAFT_739337 [Trametes maxima]|nr:hypothetical protein C8Q78DRAFT_739337 [Trametes maxima]